MKLSQLLQQREALLRQSRLSNLAFAYWHLGRLVARITGAGLRGNVRLQPADPDAERYWPVLTALEGSQSVIEEHFTDEELTDLADAIAYTTGASDLDVTFRIEQLADKFLAPVRRQLEQSGVVLDDALPLLEQTRGDGPIR